MNGEKVRRASVEWVAFTLSKYKPEQPEPGQLAEAMIAIAEQEDIGVEDVVRYIHRHEGPITLKEFGYWAKACAVTNAMQRNQPTACAHCGTELTSIEQAEEHICPEKAIVR